MERLTVMVSMIIQLARPTFVFISYKAADISALRTVKKKSVHVQVRR